VCPVLHPTDFDLDSGNLTDAKTKEIVAKIVPGIGGETGLIGSNGNFYPDARIVLQWVKDQKFAYVTVTGVG
jgi:hypothetical protein